MNEEDRTRLEEFRQFRREIRGSTESINLRIVKLLQNLRSLSRPFHETKALLNGHALGIKVNDLLGRQGKIPRDREVLGFSIASAPEDDQV